MVLGVQSISGSGVLSSGCRILTLIFEMYYTINTKYISVVQYQFVVVKLKYHFNFSFVQCNMKYSVEVAHTIIIIKIAALKWILVKMIKAKVCIN